MRGPWREAATLLLAAGRGAAARGGPGACDYEVLLLQRSARSGFLPSAHVFPGGLVEAADFSADWLGLLPASPRCGLPPLRPGAPRAPLFRARRGSPLPADVAFRLCAIRETFEEAGILLAAGRPLPPGPELAEWRRRVQRDPACFLQLCRQLRCLPDIWALHEWGNWLTPVPASGRGRRRYDTAFYLCCLGERPPGASQDQQEVTGFQWSSPPEAIECLKAKEIWFAPPQFYELCRLCNFSSLRDLHSFGSERALEGCDRWMGVYLAALDGYIELLPGDELYPKDPDYTGEKKLFLSTDKKIKELMKESSRLNRIVIRNSNNLTVHVNIHPKYKHINPLQMDSNSDCNSKL